MLEEKEPNSKGRGSGVFCREASAADFKDFHCSPLLPRPITPCRHWFTCLLSSHSPGTFLLCSVNISFTLLLSPSLPFSLLRRCMSCFPLSFSPASPLSPSSSHSDIFSLALPLSPSTPYPTPPPDLLFRRSSPLSQKSQGRQAGRE